MAQQDPGRVVCLVESDGTSEVSNGFIMVPPQTVEVTCRFRGGGVTMTKYIYELT